jgi:ribosome-binding protein aMBF1 (putative translation factor)
MINIQARQHDLFEQAHEEAVRKYEGPSWEAVIALYEAFIRSCRESITFIQQSITEDTRLRDAHPEDLELGQLLWDNITAANEIIKQQMKLISEYREIIKDARKR